jgi:hypothetical protein
MSTPTRWISVITGAAVVVMACTSSPPTTLDVGDVVATDAGGNASASDSGAPDAPSTTPA